MFSSDKIIPRLAVFSILVVIIGAMCWYYGRSFNEKAVSINADMIQKGRLSGRFWRVLECDNQWITLTKYGFRINLTGVDAQECRPGDYISFIARKGAAEKNMSLWHPEIIHFHGTSKFRFLISYIAIIMVFWMCCRHLGVRKNCWSLVFRRQKKPCLTD